MLDTALVAGAALLLGQRATTHGPLVAACALASLALVWRATRPVARLLALGLFALGAARGESALSGADAVRVSVREALGPPARCAGSGVIETSPMLRGGAVRARVRLRSLTCDERTLPPLAARLYGLPEGAARGDEIEVVAQLAPAQLFFDPDLADPRPVAARGGVSASGGVVHVETSARGRSLAAAIDRVRAAVRARIVAGYGEVTSPLARALVLGEEDLTEGDGEAFKKSGLAHLLAVSGTHLVLVVLGAVAALRALLARVTPLASRLDVGRLAAGAGVALAFLYADFAGGSGSAWRAAWMLAALLGARALGRRGSGPRALGLSALAMGLADPLVAFDASFLLSIAATGGLLAMSGAIAAALRARLPALLARIAAPIAASLAASVACAPILATMAPTLPLAGVFANVVAVPLGEAMALPLCLLHAVLPWAPAAERGSAIAASGALLGVRAIARIASSPAWAALPVPLPSAAEGAIVLVTIAALTGARPALRSGLVCLAASALVVAELFARQVGAPRGELRITFLDVGQGDAALVDLPDGRAMLVDGGGLVGSTVDVGRAVLAPTLRTRRRTRLDVVALSHPHPDHFLGLATLLPAIDVGELWDTGQGEVEGAGPVYADLLSKLRARDVPIRRPRDLCDAPRVAGGATISVLAPCPSVEPLSGPNDNSLVLRLAFGRRVALLVGDAERAEETRLLARAGDLRADVLKLGHHGSRTSSSPAFLAAVRPSLAIASVGVRNRFGHPHPATLATLAAALVPLRRTDRGGAVVWSTDGENVRVTPRLAEPGGRE